MQRGVREHWLSVIRELAYPHDDALSLFRRKAWERFVELGLPVPKAEAFQYVHWTGEPVRCPEVLQLEGAIPLAQAMRSYGLYLQNRIARLLKEESDPFAALNGALFEEGRFLYLAPGSEHVSKAVVGGGAPRLHIHLGRGASLKLFWDLQPALWRTAYIDVVLEEGASLVWVENAPQPQMGPHFSAVRVTQKRSSRFQAIQVSRGGLLNRTSLKVQLQEEGAEASFTSLALLEGTEQSHLHALIEHQAPHCRSNQKVKAVLRDRAKSSFEGKILVRPPAQKTEAYQLCNHLLLSPHASVHAKPNLEIFADDVKASHGATVAQPSQEEFFYLQSRGVAPDQAKELLVQAFTGEILQAIEPFLAGV